MRPTRSTQTILPPRWLAANMLGGMVGLSLLTLTRDRPLGQMATVFLVMVPGLLWGVLQVRAASSLQLPNWWPLVFAVGWWMGRFPHYRALAYLPQSFEQLASLVSSIGSSGPGVSNLLVAYLFVLSQLLLFGLLAGLTIAFPGLLAIWASERNLRYALTWMGNATWSWAMGLTLGGAAATLLVGTLTAVPGVIIEVPAWLMWGMTGVGAGFVYGKVNAKRSADGPL